MGGKGNEFATERASVGYFGKRGKLANFESVDFPSGRAHPIPTSQGSMGGGEHKTSIYERPRPIMNPNA